MRHKIVKTSIFLILALEMTALFAGCRPPPDSDVTSSPRYNFSSFTGTTWKTKVKVVVTDIKRYNNEHAITLFPPDSFDPADPNYMPPYDMRIITVLPVGTHLRIARLMKDNGNWGGVRVTAVLTNRENSQNIVYLDEEMLAKNQFSAVP